MTHHEDMRTEYHDFRSYIQLLFTQDSRTLLMQVFPFRSEEYFRFNLIKGQIAKELVKGLLESSGYHVYAFGYESSISGLRYDVNRHKGGTVERSPSNDRMRSMPDLIVYDEKQQRTTFVEVKYRGAKIPERVVLSSKELTLIQNYWSDCVIVVVIPAGHNFYVQKMKDIKIFDQFKTHGYDMTKEFNQIETEFPKITMDNIRKYWTIRAKFLTPNGQEQEDTED